MRHPKEPKTSLLVTAVAVALAAVVILCPLSMVAHAQMTQMMGQDMATQGMQGTCPMLWGVPPYLAGLEPSSFGFGPLPVYLNLNPTSTVRPIFHPPTIS